MQRLMTLPVDSAERKRYPLLRGLLRYFPAALAGVSRCSMLGNEKHNPGEELHHARGKSTDHGDCVPRHLVDIQDILAVLDRGECATADERAETLHALFVEVDQMTWRALAYAQELYEKYGGAPMAPGAKTGTDA